jgi:hypothetical protein
MEELEEIKKYQKSQKLNKVLLFLKQNNIEIENNSKIYFLKSLNEKSGSKTKYNLIKKIDYEKNFSLAIMPNEKTVGFDQMEMDPTTVFGNEYYDLYLISNISNRHYYMVIQENNFFKDRVNFQLVYLKSVKIFNYKILFLLRNKIN